MTLKLLNKYDVSFVISDETEKLQQDSILNIRYAIAGDRANGAHMPVAVGSPGPEDLIFRSSLVLQRPVLDPCLAVGFLPLPSSGLRVGQLVPMKWRIERLKDFQDNTVSKKDVRTLSLVMNNQNFTFLLRIGDCFFTCFDRMRYCMK